MITVISVLASVIQFIINRINIGYKGTVRPQSFPCQQAHLLTCNDDDLSRQKMGTKASMNVTEHQELTLAFELTSQSGRGDTCILATSSNSPSIIKPVKIHSVEIH